MKANEAEITVEVQNKSKLYRSETHDSGLNGFARVSVTKNRTTRRPPAPSRFKENGATSVTTLAGEAGDDDRKEGRRGRRPVLWDGKRYTI